MNTSKEIKEVLEEVKQLFFNNVVEATIHYIKFGGDGGVTPEEFLNKQLSGFEKEYDETIKKALKEAEQRGREEVENTLKKEVPKHHFRSVADSVWLTRLLNKVFNNKKDE